MSFFRLLSFIFHFLLNFFSLTHQPNPQPPTPISYDNRGMIGFLEIYFFNYFFYFSV